MIDPIGLAGTASGLVSLTIQLAQTTTNIITTLRTAPKQWSELVITLHDLTPILQKLADLPAGDYDCLERPLSTLRTHLLYLRKRLVEIRRTKKWRFRLKWLMRKEEVGSIVTALERAKGVLLVGMQEMQLETTMNLQTTVEDSAASLASQFTTKLETGRRSLHGRLHSLAFAMETGHNSIESQLRHIAKVLKANSAARSQGNRAHDHRKLIDRLLVKELRAQRRVRVHSRMQLLKKEKDLHIIGTIVEEEIRLVMCKAAGAAAPLAFALCVIFFLN